MVVLVVVYEVDYDVVVEVFVVFECELCYVDDGFGVVVVYVEYWGLDCFGDVG